MKLYRSFTIIVIILLVFASCKKDNGPINVNLIDKSPFFIEQYIAGRWKFVYTTGGWMPRRIYSPDSIFIEFNFYKDSIYNINHTVVTHRESIRWTKVKDGKDYVSTINGFWGVSGIYNDTLVLFQPGVMDGSSYALVKD